MKENPRVRVAQIVMDYLQYRWNADTFCEQYPHLSQAEVYAALLYYYDHLQEIDEEIRKEQLEAEDVRKRAGPSPIAEKLRAQKLL